MPNYLCHIYLMPDHRGIQYVHWVMHKCIMVKVGGKKYKESMKKAGEFF